MKIINTDDLRDLGIVLNSFVVSSPKPKHNREYIDGRNGFVDMGTTYDGRTIQAKITILPDVNKQYSTLRDEVFSLFDSKEPFYLVHENRRWLVKCNSDYSFKQTANFGETTIQFISSGLFAESIGTTLEPITFRNNPKLSEKGLNLTENDYIHTTDTFKIYNLGEKIDPREMPLKIHFVGQSNNLTIKNTTTGDKWKYYGTTEPWDSITIDGIKSYKYASSIFRDTNYGVIELEKGWNEFTISGATDFEIKFEHRFYYL